MIALVLMCGPSVVWVTGCVLWWGIIPAYCRRFGKRTPVVTAAAVLLDTDLGWHDHRYSERRHATGICISQPYSRELIALTVLDQLVPLTLADRHMLWRSWQAHQSRVKQRQADDAASLLASRVEQFAAQMERFGDTITSMRSTHP